VTKSEAEWKKGLSSREYSVIRGKGTEPAGSGDYNKLQPKGGYFACRACQNPLYSAQSKFSAGCGWPAFDKCYKGSVVTKPDGSLGCQRIEIMCAQCGGHLGHVFEGERFTSTNERHCVNSISVRYMKDQPPPGLEEDKVV
jgi:peptide-methionine (R)-S-oxide reductase